MALDGCSDREWRSSCSHSNLVVLKPVVCLKHHATASDQTSRSRAATSSPLQTAMDRATLFGKHRQVESVCHSGVAKIIGMNVVTGVEVRADARRMLFVQYGRIEIDDGVEFAAGSDPLIQFLSCGFTYRTREPHTLFRHNGSANDFDLVRMCASDNLAVALDQILGSQGVWTGDLAMEVDVVDALQQDDPTHARLTKHIAIEPCQSADSSTVAKNLIAGDALVDDGDMWACLPFTQPLGEQCRPGLVFVDRCCISIRDGIAQAGNGKVIGGRNHK